MTPTRALVGLILVAGGCASADQTFTISGNLIRQGNQRPIAHALVTITANDHPDQQVSLKTAEDGRFTFTGVPKGKYTLNAEYHGFSEDYRQNEEYSTGIVAGFGLDSEHVVFPLELPGSLSVSVLDEAGEAVGNADVMLFRRQVESGRATITQIGTGVSYANGIYKFSNLKPGAYFVGVQGRPWYAQPGEMAVPAIEGREHRDEEVVFPETYYPNTSDPDQARSVAIREGENTRIEFNLRPVAALRITVSGPGFDRNTSPERQISGNATVMSIGPGGALFPSSISMTTMNDHFLITGVAPGRHVISVSRWGGTGGTGPNETLQSGVIDMTSDYTLNTGEIAAASLSGHLVIEGGALPGHHLMLMMRASNRSTTMTRIQKDGSFKSDVPLIPGQYQPMLVNTGDLYIKDFAALGASFEAGFLRVRGAERIELTITAAKGLMKADGVATASGQPAPGALVVLIPDNPKAAGEYPRDQSDSDGTFTLRGISPGRYHLLAIDDGRELEYRDRTVMTRYLAKAPQLEFPAAANTPIAVEVQKRQH